MASLLKYNRISNLNYTMSDLKNRSNKNTRLDDAFTEMWQNNINQSLEDLFFHFSNRLSEIIKKESCQQTIMLSYQ